MADCLFCKIVAGEIPADVVLSTEHTVAFRDVNPQAPLHVLVVPKDHFANAVELADGQPATVAELVSTADAVARADGYPDDYRLVLNTGAGAGQSVFHAHLHVLAGRPDLAARMSAPFRLVARLAVGALVAAFLVGLWKVGPGGNGTDAAADPTTPATASVAPVDPSPSTAVAPVTHQHASGPPPKPVPLRAGEHRMTLQMPTTYTPSAPYGQGTDDYRCFILDPKLAHDVWLTGSTVKPGNPDVVHHVILFRVSAADAQSARDKDASDPGPGWTCFGGSGVAGEFDNLDDASWLGAWAPGSRESVLHAGYGIPLDKGSLIVMQVHYNLLAGDEPDRSAVSLRWTPKTTPLKPLHTMLFPAPVELPCRPDHAQSPLCDRDASLADVEARFGDVGQTANLLHLLCGTPVVATTTTTCTRPISQGLTVIGAAGHMHLLGRWIKIVANEGTPREKTLLDIPVWDFDNQAAHPIKPVHLDAGDTVTVTCHHDQSLRDLLPALHGFPDKYVVWGEGTTDEMCLGMLQVAFDSDQ